VESNVPYPIVNKLSLAFGAGWKKGMQVMFWLLLVIILGVLVLHLVVLAEVRNPIQLRYPGRKFLRVGSGQFLDEQGRIVNDRSMIENLEKLAQKIFTDRTSEIPTFWPK